MRSLLVPLISSVLTLTLAGCATIQPARMALAPALSDGAEVVPIVGVGGNRKGQFAAGNYSGGFHRSDTRLAVFDPLFERRSGFVRFSLAGPEINGMIDADCRVRERTVTLSVLSFEPQPMAYACTFGHEGRILPARLELQAHREGLGSMLMKQERRGEIAFDRLVLGIRSVHALQGSPIRTSTPVGYVFERDGITVGAVERNGGPVIRFAASADAPTRRAVLLAGIALGLVWDPAESPLGREAG